MFAVVFDGRVNDRAKFKERMDAWVSDVQPSADGFEGMTVTCAADGRFLAVVRFVSREAGEGFRDGAAQQAWLEASGPLFEDGPRSRVSDDIELIFGGGSDEAGFVQVIESEPKDRKHLISLEASLLPVLESERPDVMGSIRVWHGPGSATEVIYFTSEAEARAGEAKGIPDQYATTFSEMMGLANPVEFIDSDDPWLISP